MYLSLFLRPIFNRISKQSIDFSFDIDSEMGAALRSSNLMQGEARRTLYPSQLCHIEKQNP
jgi:hypothetical protein